MSEVRSFADELLELVPTLENPLQVEMFCSQALSTWGDDENVALARDATFADLVDELREIGTPEALALLRGLAVVSYPNAIGMTAALYADDLTRDGVAVLPCLTGIGTAEFASAWALLDDGAGVDELFVTFDYLAGRDHTIAVRIEDGIVTEVGCVEPMPVPDPRDPGLEPDVAGAALIELLDSINQLVAWADGERVNLLHFGPLAYARAQALVARRTA
jgi:hypothetical protein